MKLKRLLGTKEQKDSSSNQITEEELKEGGDATVKILSTEDTPSHFLKMQVTPVFKKGDSYKQENCKAIIFLSILRKVFNRIILEKG